jgi:hypothetical protein
VKELAPERKSRGKLILVLRDANDKSVQLGLQPYLAAEAARGAHIEGEIEHILFHRRRAARLFFPGVVDINMARRAGASASAFCNYAGDRILDRGFHDGLAGLALNLVRRPVMLYVCYLDHVTVASLNRLLCKGDRRKIQRANFTNATRLKPPGKRRQIG